MKKILAILLAVMLTISFVSCESCEGGNDEPPNNNEGGISLPLVPIG